MGLAERLRNALAAVGAVGILAAVVGALFFASELRGFLKWRKEASRPAAAVRTVRAERWERYRAEAELQIPDVPPKDLSRIQKKFARPDLVASRGGFIEGSVRAGGVVLDETEDTRPAPHGVDLLTVLEPDGTVRNIVAPKPEPVTELLNEWSVGAKLRQYLLAGRMGEGYVRLDLARALRYRLALEGGATWWEESGEIDPFIGADLRARFK